MHFLSRILHLLALAALLSSANPLAAQSGAPADHGKGNDQAARIHRIEASTVDISMGEGQLRLRLTLTELMRAYNEPAFSVAVIDNFQVAWAKGYGVTAAGSSTPVTVHTTFQAASISKPVTATAALSLVDHGKLTLDEDVNVKLIHWKVPENELTKTEKVTLRRILSHSAGLTVHGFAGYEAGAPIPSVEQILNGEKPANSPPVRVDVTPGTIERYSGGGVTIEQLLLTDVTGKPFSALLRELVLDKLSMADSSFEQPPSPQRAKFAASATAADNKTLHGRWHVYPEMAAAGLWTTPSDLARFLIEISLAKNGKSQKILSQAMAQLMLTPVIHDAGLGFFLPQESPGEFGHSGSNEGFECNMKMNVNSGRGLVMMTNSDNGFEVMKFFENAVAKEYGWPVNSRQLDAGARVLVVSVAKGVPLALRLYESLKSSHDPIDKTDEGTLNFVGERLLAIGAPEKAITAYQRNLKEYPRSAGAYNGLGEAYLKMGNKVLAIADFKAALEIEPSNQRTRDKLAQLLAQ
jgi:CubicO group peptidase (beta-lactamase class C family)